jgi:Ankyrin repeats (3 copies)
VLDSSTLELFPLFEGGIMKSILVLLASLSLTCAGALYADDSHTRTIEIFDQAKAAIESGHVVPERDLAPVIDLLQKTTDQEELERIVDDVGDLGEADGSSPAAVKRYLLDKSTPTLIGIAEDRKNNPQLRGTAISALRGMGASRAVLQRVADMALKDPDSFVQSRGEILRNFIGSMPAEEEKNIRPKNAATEQEAIAFLKERNLGVSLDQLRLSSIEAHPDEVTALIGAGVDPNSGPAEDSPLSRAISGCAAGRGDESVVKTIDALAAGGADMKKSNSSNTSPLFSAAQSCGPKVVLELIKLGASVNVANDSGLNPLSMALITSNLDTAEALVSKGAKLNANQVQMVSGTATSARAKAIVAKAKGAKKK